MIRRKWRPSLGLVVTSVVGLVLLLPLAGLFLFNFYGKQLVQQTEESLIAQTAMLAAVFEEAFRQNRGDPRIGKPLPPELLDRQSTRLRPIFPSLSLSSSAIYLPRPDAQPAIRPMARAYSGIGQVMTRIARRSQSTTLAGYRVIDPFGRVIGGSGEVGQSLAHVEEVSLALSGVPTTRLRQRISDEPTPPVWSMSRRSSVRVFVAMPAIVDGHVIGVTYISRTPGNVVQYLYLERANLIRTGIGIALAALAIGFVFWRFITRPIYGLIRTTQDISQGDPDAIRPLRHYGTREVAQLGESFLVMAEALQNRASAVQTFTAHVTHELKSPLTSVLGAAELMRDSGADMPAERRHRFLDNIAGDASRMSQLLDELRSLAIAREIGSHGTSLAAPIAAEIASRFPGLTVRCSDDRQLVPISAENLTVILTHMIENSAEHGATTVELETIRDVDALILSIADDGKGVDPKDAERIFDPFFTTRRDKGGTGMGLGIVAAILATAGAEITLVDTVDGTRFDIRFPDAL